MIARAGASVSLSLVIVATAAVVVHRPQPARVPVAILPPAPPPRTAHRSAPIATPSLPWPEPERPKAAVETGFRVMASPKAVPPKRPESPFTKVERGETLADVVRRVYGSGGRVEAVWKVNREQLPTIEAGLRSGMILRTPELQ
ncbi:MAG: hypothetical protein JWN86_2431 [Planctomycetota bacterium]|nr:hypothetical protein [Planctomycetota bacterium]